jgi:hypothetical protein
MSNYEHELDLANIMLKAATAKYRAYKHIDDVDSYDISDCLVWLREYRSRICSIFDSLGSLYSELCKARDNIYLNNSKYIRSYYENGSSELLQVLKKIAHIDEKVKRYIGDVKFDAEKLSDGRNYDEKCDERNLETIELY